ncbi:MAG: ParB/RepB/Spo0J family partition protein [Pseudomonadota bacterium]|nr:ParB/RepB/Spo0J family partition protein [Pseudomonadota bacterium]
MNKGLGKGLGALLDDSDFAVGSGFESTGAPQVLSVTLLGPSDAQPRRTFDEDALKALSESIKSQGVLQPLLVRPTGDRYEIIAGERRWRASQMAGLSEVPVIVKEMDDGRALEIALVENVQRSDLNPIDEADGYLRLMNEFNYTHEQIAKVTGKSRSHVTNLMRLLSLPKKLKECVSEGLLTMGHARALLGLAHDESLQLRIANQVIKKTLSVRETEDLVRKHSDGKKKKEPRQRNVSPATLELESRMQTVLGSKVQVTQKEGVGHIKVFFEDSKELLDIVNKISQS